MSKATILAITVLFLLAGCANVTKELQSGMNSATEQRAQQEATLPHCSRVIGTAAIVEPDNNWWQQIQLQSPEALIKIFVLKSGCFTLVDRGRGFDLSERERALARNGTLRHRSNVGKGQVKAADYLITPDIVSNNNNAGGNALGALLGAVVPGVGGVIASNITLNNKSADVTLAVTDTRSSEQVAMTEGTASKTDIGFGAGGGILTASGIGGAAVSSYANTALGQVVAMAYLDAYSKMVAQLGGLPTNAATANNVAAADAGQAVAPANGQAVAMERSGHLFHGPSVKSGAIRELPPGTILYPTSKKSGTWEEVTDKSGNKGWVSSRFIAK
ncbi:MAG: CsgG/HfaB family protein [Burkholderiales bacterium]